MRRFNETITVRHGLETADQLAAGTMDFLWRGRIWRVTEVLGHWRETGPWWEGAMARLQGENDSSAELAEHVVWRVHATSGMYGSSGIYELAHHHGGGEWRVRTVVD